MAFQLGTNQLILKTYLGYGKAPHGILQICVQGPGKEIGIDMILCDTNIFIHAFNGNAQTILDLQKIGFENIVLSSITVMELFQGMGNKKELSRMKSRIKYYDVIEFDKQVSKLAQKLIENYSLSHGLMIPDAIIGATAVIHEIPLFTYNVKNFRYIPDLTFFK